MTPAIWYKTMVLISKSFYSSVIPSHTERFWLTRCKYFELFYKSDDQAVNKFKAATHPPPPPQKKKKKKKKRETEL